MQKQVQQRQESPRFPFIPNNSSRYRITPASNRQISLDINLGQGQQSNILVYTNHQGNNQRWRITIDTIGNYSFISDHQERVMEAQGDKVHAAKSVSGPHFPFSQRWRIFSVNNQNVSNVNNGRFQIRQNDRGFALRRFGGSGSGLTVAPYQGNENDIWSIIEEWTDNS